jgi:formate hydrogenlyase subunit 3/multisubunit Na+/H+ antiporter MnhD subunit
VHEAHALSAFVAIMLMAVAIASLVYRAQGWRHLREPASALMIALYVAGVLLVLLRSGGLTP